MNAWALDAVGAAAVLFAGLMLAQRSLYTAAVCLLAVLLQTAALFYLSGAPLLAFLQIMIYAGGVMVLIVVTIMASPEKMPKLTPPGWAGKPLAVAALCVPAVLLGLLLSRAAAPATTAGSARALGPILFGPYAVATEAVTLLMFLAALALVGRRGERA